MSNSHGEVTELSNSEFPKFKVIHLSTGHLGGAGLAARRLNQDLRLRGINSSFIALAHDDFQPEIGEFDIRRGIFTSFISKATTFLNIRFSKKTLFTLVSISSLKRDTISKLGDPLQTILHFHNWFNLVTQRQIFNLMKQGYKIVVTLHDQRLLTGGCHYSFECRGFETGCSACPEIPRVIRSIPSINARKFSKRLNRSKSVLYLIAPSRWMLREVEQSFTVRTADLSFIPNTLGPENILLAAKASSRPSSLLTIGIASMDPSSYTKGGDITQRLESEIASKNIPLKFIYLNSLKFDQDPTINFWGEIDYLLVASRAENSPNVIHEAKNLGIPVIASQVGGISELLTSDFDIAIDVNTVNAKILFELINENENNRMNLEQKSKMGANFNSYTSNATDKHIKLYERIMSENN
jgi:glycosyltransferase involved in cell wall biosynthesis